MTKPSKSRGAALHDRIEAAYAPTATESEVLVELARLLDHLDALHTALACQLTSTGSTGQAVAHPLLAELRAGRRQLLELLAALRLPSSEKPDAYDALVEQLSRPAGGGSS